MSIETKQTSYVPFIEEYPEVPFPKGLITDEYPFAAIVRLENYNDDGEFHPIYILKLAKERFYLHKNVEITEIKCDVIDYAGYITMPSVYDGLAIWLEHHMNSSTNYWGEITETQYPIWANHDIIDVSTNEVFLQKGCTEPEVITTTITLPDIPHGYEQYSNAFILHGSALYEGSMIEMYMLICTDEPLYVSAIENAPYDTLNFLDDKGNAITFMLDTSAEVSTWVKDDEDLVDGSLEMPVGTVGQTIYEISWSNYDILKADTNEIYFQNSETPKKGIVIDGITLPDLPTEYQPNVTDKYPNAKPSDFPYCVITDIDNSEEQVLFAVCTKSPIYIAKYDGNIVGALSLEEGYAIWTSNGENWNIYAAYIPDNNFLTGSGSIAIPPDLFIQGLKWSNYDVEIITLNITDEGEEEFVLTGEIYFPNSETTSVLPEYLSESSDWFKSVNNEIRRISGALYSFEFTKENISELLYGMPISEKTAIEGTYSRIVVPLTINVNVDTLFSGCDSLKFIDLGDAPQIKASTMRNSEALETLILRSPTMVVVNDFTGTGNTTYPLYGTEIASGAGYIYVPSVLIDLYKNDTVNGWSKYSTQFRAIEDYPEICG